MSKYRVTPRADRDLRQIWSDIAPHDERAADALLRRLFDKFALVAEHPNIGVARPDVGAKARILIAGNYIAIYESKPDGVDIIAVVHGKRSPENWLLA